MRHLFPFMLAAVVAAPGQAQSQAQTPRHDAVVRAYFAPFAEAGDFSGVALLMRGDTVLAQVFAGEAAPGRTVTTDTRFRIASLTKPFTSAAVLRLVQQGRVSLGASVCAYISPCPEAWRPITLRHLLSHTAGIADYTGLPGHSAVKAQPTTPAALVAGVAGLPLEFAPGQRYGYSNSNYAVLGRVIETVTGQSYPDALRALVLAPLNLTGIHYGDVAGGAEGYRLVIGGREKATAVDLSWPYAAGGLVATATEVAAFARGFFRSGLLADSLISTALTPIHNRYGLGWRTSPIGPGRSAWHGGAIDGFVSFLGYRPDEDLTVVVLANVEEAPVQRMALDLLRMADGMTVVTPTVRRAVELPEVDLADVVGTYRVDPSFEFAVRRSENGGLEVQATGQRPAPIFAERRDAFFSRVIDAQFTFERDGAGKVTRMVLHQGGRPTPAERI